MLEGASISLCVHCLAQAIRLGDISQAKAAVFLFFDCPGTPSSHLKLLIDARKRYVSVCILDMNLWLDVLFFL